MTYWMTRNPRVVSEFRQLHDQINRQFGISWSPTAQAYPAINLWTNNDGIALTAELPGIDAESLEVTTLEDALTIKGTIPGGGSDEERNWLRRDRRQRDFSRTIQLPYAVDQDGVQATLRDGVLEVRLKRSTVQEPRRIEVEAG